MGKLSTYTPPLVKAHFTSARQQTFIGNITPNSDNFNKFIDLIDNFETFLKINPEIDTLPFGQALAEVFLADFQDAKLTGHDVVDIALQISPREQERLTARIIDLKNKGLISNYNFRNTPEDALSQNLTDVLLRIKIKGVKAFNGTTFRLWLVNAPISAHLMAQSGDLTINSVAMDRVGNVLAHPDFLPHVKHGIAETLVSSDRERQIAKSRFKLLTTNPMWRDFIYYDPQESAIHQSMSLTHP